MASIQYWMNYVIFFQDEADYQFAVGVAGSNLLQMAPRDAAVLFGIAFPYPTGDMSSIPKGIYFIYPYTPGAQFMFPNASGLFVDDTVLTATVPGQAGVPASIWPAGPDGVFTWSGNIVRSAGAGVDADPPTNAIAQRRWCGGRELAGDDEGGASSSNANIGLDFSRVIGGYGLCIRGNASIMSWNRSVDTYRPGLQPPTSWERFYIRVRSFPTTNPSGVWRCHGFSANAAGFGIKILNSGVMQGFNISLASVETDAGTIFTPVINQWYRIDIFLKYDQGVSSDGRIRVYVDGVLSYSFTVSNGVGMNDNDYHTNSDLGLWNAITDQESEIDLDDWICADLPANVDTATLDFIDDNYSIDWLLGSHVRAHYAVSATQNAWGPAGIGVGVANQFFMPQQRLQSGNTSELNSTTSGTTLEILSDALLQSEFDTLANILGAVAAIISIWSSNSASTDGQLGYKKAGAGAVLATINQTAAEAVQTVAYLPSGMIIPDEISPWSEVHTKSADANTGRVFMLTSVVEYLGVWGPEDDPLFQFPISRLSWLHNARYFNTQYGYLGSEPAAPVFAVGGTYVGNGTYQEITLPGPCHFLWIRGTTVGSGGIKFFGSGNSAHVGAKDRCIPNVRVWFDLAAGLFKFSVVGDTNSECNANGITYQYIAFCDPGMRFNICGQYGHSNGSSTPKANPLIADGFLADGGFIQSDWMGTTSNTLGLWFRGPGNTAQGATPLDGSAQEANGYTFSAGFLETYSRMHAGGNGNPAYNYSLWRISDSGVGGCIGVMIQIVQYTGDGAGSKVITLTPTSGRFPLFVVVSAATGTQASFMRDPSHTGTNSANVDTLANSTTAITAVAMDEITVGAALNVAARVYNVFVICGDTAGMNNGTYYPTYCINEGPWEDPDLPAGDINIVANAGLVFDGIAPLLLMKDVSGIYTLVKDLHHDALIDRNTLPATEVNVKIPDPIFKTGYVGG